MVYRFRTPSSAMLGLVTLLASTACKSDPEPDIGESGDAADDGTNHDGEGSGWCDETRTEIPVDEKTALGIPADVLSPLVGSHPASLRWYPKDGPISFDWQGETTMLTIGVSDSITGAALIESEPSDSCDKYEIDCGECPDQLEVLTEITFTTEDGRFAETWPVALRFGGSGTAYFRKQLKPDESTFDGSFRFEQIDAQDGEITMLQASGTLGAHTNSGSFMIEMRGGATESDEGWIGAGPIAEWNDGDTDGETETDGETDSDGASAGDTGTDSDAHSSSN